MQQDQGHQRAYREGQAESDSWGCTPGKVGQCGVGVGGSQGTPGLGGQSVGRLPERREGRGGGWVYREHCGVGNMVSAILSTFLARRVTTKSPDVPVRGYLCVPFHSLHKWNVFPPVPLDIFFHVDWWN